jgi:hypothetical protein
LGYAAPHKNIFKVYFKSRYGLRIVWSHYSRLPIRFEDPLGSGLFLESVSFEPCLKDLEVIQEPVELDIS